MEAAKTYRIKITSWTASFRYPNLISGLQPTLDVPPLSTVLGLINAAAGEYLEYKKFRIGYYFRFKAKYEDLETIYQLGYQSHTGVKSNVIKRELLFENELFLYLTDKKVVDYLSKPRYQILLGRSGDLATINPFEEVLLKPIKNASKIKGQIVPFEPYHLPGVIQALPAYFSNDIPRESLGTKPYSVISCHTKDFETNISCHRDPKLDDEEVDIFFHEAL